MSKPKYNTAYYRTLVREFNRLEAIPADKRTGFERQQLVRIKRSLDDYETHMMIGEAQG